MTTLHHLGETTVPPLPASPASPLTAMMIRIRRLVQGVGFRPTVWRLARCLGLRGHGLNDGEGLLIHLVGLPDTIGNSSTTSRRDRRPWPGSTN
ncbi:MAG TPA: acylphosphatase [Nitrospiraceae bacterium]|nr:acylphosphatase [Nitrospiraceae bacterium]